MSSMASTPDLTQLLNPGGESWDIDTALKRFVVNPQGLRECLRDVDGLISGGFALSFLARTQWPESDLDICVHRSRGEELAEYLVKAEGYDLASSKVGKYNWSEVEEVHTYDKPTTNPKVNRVIELVFTKKEPVKSVLTECYTTALVNVISYNTAYSLFPIPTLVDKLTFSLKEPDYFHNILLQKYRLRGYRAIQRLPTEQEDVASGNAFSTKSRRVGDELTWKVALSGIAPSQTPSAVEHVCFDICEGKESLEEWRWMVLKPVN